MITENISTLKIHKMSEKQYNRELATGNINNTDIYLVQDTSNSSMENIAYIDDIHPLPSEVLQSIFTFKYYSTLAKAIADINAGTVENTDATESNGNVGVYTNHKGQKVAIILSDITETETSTITTSTTINLNGKCLSFSSGARLGGANGATIIIDGRLAGSKIYKKTTAENNVAEGLLALTAQSGCKAKVVGGAYIIDIYSSSKNVYGFSVNETCEIEMFDCSVSAYSRLGGGFAYGVRTIPGKAKIVNSTIYADAPKAIAKAFYNNAGEVELIKSKFIGDALSSSADNISGSLASGVESEVGGLLVMEDCIVQGTHSGLSNSGELHARNCFFEGIGHGGVYFSNSTQNAYIENSTISSAKYHGSHKADFDYADQYDVAAIYVGGSAIRNNIKVYLDNCKILSGTSYSIVLRGTSGEQNNSIYMSNCEVSGATKLVRVDNNTHKVYLGMHNNFTESDMQIAECIVNTQDVYYDTTWL